MIFPERSAEFYSRMTNGTVAAALIVNLIVLTAMIWSKANV